MPEHTLPSSRQRRWNQRTTGGRTKRSFGQQWHRRTHRSTAARAASPEAQTSEKPENAEAPGLKDAPNMLPTHRSPVDVEKHPNGDPEQPMSANSALAEHLEMLISTPILDDEETCAAMLDSVHLNAKTYFKSFYSSALGGITTHPAFMSIPMDDHLVHRGHGVFDTAIVADGCMYMLEQHLDRFLASAAAARIPLPCHRNKLRTIILDVAAASGEPFGLMRYWLSAGRGDYNLTPEGCMRPEFYCAFYTGPYHERDPLEGVKVSTSRVPNKPGMFAEMKSVDYMQNVHNAMCAHDDGADYGIFVKESGEVAEGPTLNVSMISRDGVVRTPPFDECLAGCTISRLAEIIAEREEAGEPLTDIKGFEQGPLTVKDMSEASEIFLTGGSLPIVGVTHWDGHVVGNGDVGRATLVLRKALKDDMLPQTGKRVLQSDYHTWVPYGRLTGMRDDF